jgi:predicted anti-sigma-YlaC factor YlaD
MDCSVIQADLIAYHFGTTPDPMRERIDEHLLSCTDCLRAYLRVKGHLAKGASQTERMSPAAREKLRRAVAAEFTPSARTKVTRWLHQPIPLYQGVAAAAVVLALALIAPLLAATSPPSRAGDRERATASGERVDTSRPSPESLSFY